MIRGKPPFPSPPPTPCPLGRCSPHAETLPARGPTSVGHPCLRATGSIQQMSQGPGVPGVSGNLQRSDTPHQSFSSELGPRLLSVLVFVLFCFQPIRSPLFFTLGVGLKPDLINTSHTVPSGRFLVRSTEGAVEQHATRGQRGPIESLCPWVPPPQVQSPANLDLPRSW